MVFQLAFKDSSEDVYIYYRTTGKLFNIKRFTARTKTMMCVIRELLYADDCALLTHTEMEMQHLIDSFEAACTALGLAISLKKNVLMYQPTSGKTYVEPSIYVYGQKLAVVPKFVYLGSTLNYSNSIDDKVDLRISKASHVFGILHKRLWSRRGISICTKVKVYNTCVLTVLLYASETWTTFNRHLKQLERFHQQCLRKILGIKWQMHISDTEILEMANIGSIEVLISKQQLRWSGHLVRLPNERIQKQIFYGQLTDGKRLAHKPKKRFKDCLKQTFKKCGIILSLIHLSRILSYMWQLWKEVQVLCGFEKPPPSQKLFAKQWQYLKTSCCHHLV